MSNLMMDEREQMKYDALSYLDDSKNSLLTMLGYKAFDRFSDKLYKGKYNVTRYWIHPDGVRYPKVYFQHYQRPIKDLADIGFVNGAYFQGILTKDFILQYKVLENGALIFKSHSNNNTKLFVPAISIKLPNGKKYDKVIHRIVAGFSPYEKDMNREEDEKVQIDHKYRDECVAIPEALRPSSCYENNRNKVLEKVDRVFNKSKGKYVFRFISIETSEELVVSDLGNKLKLLHDRDFDVLVYEKKQSINIVESIKEQIAHGDKRDWDIIQKEICESLNNLPKNCIGLQFVGNTCHFREILGYRVSYDNAREDYTLAAAGFYEKLMYGEFAYNPLLSFDEAGDFELLFHFYITKMMSWDDVLKAQAEKYRNNPFMYYRYGLWNYFKRYGIELEPCGIDKDGYLVDKNGYSHCKERALLRETEKCSKY